MRITAVLLSASCQSQYFLLPVILFSSSTLIVSAPALFTSSSSFYIPPFQHAPEAFPVARSRKAVEHQENVFGLARLAPDQPTPPSRQNVIWPHYRLTNPRTCFGEFWRQYCTRTFASSCGIQSQFSDRPSFKSL
jgi:hypothetical protein